MNFSTKVIHPNYSKYLPYLSASTLVCGCGKILYHGWNHGYYISFAFRLFGMYIHSKLNWKFSIKIYLGILLQCLRITFFMYKVMCQKPAHFLSAQMAVLSSFLQVFILLGMYNFSLLHCWQRYIPISP